MKWYVELMRMVFFCVALSHSRSVNADVGFQLDGLVVQSSTTFGIDVPNSSPMGVRLILDSQSVASGELSGCDCETYRHHVLGGFTATFTNLSISTSSYAVEVTNNFSQGGGADIIRVSFYSTPILKADTPVSVNGQPVEYGDFSLLLQDQEGTAIDSKALPTLVSLDAFETKLFFLKDIGSPLPPSVPDIVATLFAATPLIPEPGDFDLDGTVSGSDFLEWQREFGSQSRTAADADSNSIVDSADLDIWVTHYTSGESISTDALPEPSTQILVLIAACAIRCYRRLGYRIYAVV